MVSSIGRILVHPEDPNLVLELTDDGDVRIFDLLATPKADVAAGAISSGGIKDACWLPAKCGEAVFITVTATGLVKAYSALLCLLAPPPKPQPEPLQIRSVPELAFMGSITALCATTCNVIGFTFADGVVRLFKPRFREVSGHDHTLWLDIIKIIGSRPGSPMAICSPTCYAYCHAQQDSVVLEGFGSQRARKHCEIDYPDGAVGVVSLAATTDVLALVFDLGMGKCQLCTYSTYEVPPSLVHSDVFDMTEIKGPLHINSIRDTNAVVMVISSSRIVVRSRTYAEGERWVTLGISNPPKCCALIPQLDGMGWDRCLVAGTPTEDLRNETTRKLSRSSLPLEDSNPVIALHRSLDAAFAHTEYLPSWCLEFADENEVERLVTDGPSRRFYIKLAFVLSSRHRKECEDLGIAVNTEDCFLASIGASQDYLTQLVTRAAPTDDIDAELWSTFFRRLGVGFWAHSLTLLRSTVLNLLLKRSLVKYRRTKELSVIEDESALWLALLGRQKVLASLYRQHAQLFQDPKAMRVSRFLAMDFTIPENKRIGSKNAFELIRQKRHSMAAAVFLLIGDVQSAVNVATRYIEDVQLAILFCRCSIADGAMTKDQVCDLMADKLSMFDAWVDYWRLWSSHDYAELARKLAHPGSQDLAATGSADFDSTLGVLPTPPHLNTCPRRDIFEYLSSMVPAFGVEASDLEVQDTPSSVVTTRLLGRGLAALLPAAAEDSDFTSPVHWARRASIIFDEFLTPRKASKMPHFIPGKPLNPPIGSDLQSYWIRRVRGALLDPRLHPMPPAPELWSILSRVTRTSKGGSLLPSWAAELTSMVLAGIGDWSTSVPEIQEAAAAVVLSELERLLLEHEAAANGTVEKKEADDARLTLAEHYTGVLLELLQPGCSPQVAVGAHAAPLPCLSESAAPHAMRLRSLVVCSLVLERVLSPPKGSPELTVYERQYQLLVRWHLKTHIYEAIMEPDVVQADKADELVREHPLERALEAWRRIKLLQSSCPVYRQPLDQDKESLPKSLPLTGIRRQLEWHSVTGLCLDRSTGASLRLAVSARHEEGLVKVIDLPQLLRSSSPVCRTRRRRRSYDEISPEEYYRDDSQWRMDIERSVINSNTNLPVGTKIVPSERTMRSDSQLGSGLPLRPDCRLYARDVMLLSLGINWSLNDNAVARMFDNMDASDASADELSVSNSLAAHPTASVFASATGTGLRVWSFGCPSIDEPARPLCMFESPHHLFSRDSVRIASWSDDGGMLAGVSKKGRMSLWSTCRADKPIISFKSPYIRANDVKALTPSGSLMLLCGRETSDGSGGAAMIDCRSPELVVRKWEAGPGREYTCVSGLSTPHHLQLGTCDGRVVNLDTRAEGRCKTAMLYTNGHERSPAIYSLLRYGPTHEGVVAVTHGSAVGVIQAGRSEGSFDSQYTMHKGGMKSSVQAAFSKIGPKLVAAADACGTVAITAGTSDEQILLHRLP
ncbi:hypothetical protein Pmar_PMAR017665 [Perkinsus marinus ATCC 50983]|uniref:RAVE complex protein Rav1 C-terminal domain-containing protein n=1 Tax=Perkinsus marinus (strain ATCC 50983 / TXsc) TaxID=423536 RepID=C5L3N1_PERM5|nr:hypothetical protein Pmar_PMAR017665 [Perkinsus marinus ATCC 50983]EER08610.1 hypothetical protein Pmar_PMAR017665 [Perkinsus marinus ATCC 50983]|eukprot:XP_002776794.1 hypothetical protein Pmar_PMAR017665 [Perkinsus marinus ATCC 50983]